MLRSRQHIGQSHQEMLNINNTTVGGNDIEQILVEGTILREQEEERNDIDCCYPAS